MNKRYIFCVESNSISEIDDQYIKATIERFYEKDQNIVIRTEYMNSKTRYKDSGLKKKLDGHLKYFHGDHKIFYCIDIDDYNVSPETNRLLDCIKEYCKEKGYELILFCKDIEDVYWGKRVHDNEKRRMAKLFKTSNQILNIQEKQLRKTGFSSHSSNILTILDKYFTNRSV